MENSNQPLTTAIYWDVECIRKMAEGQQPEADASQYLINALDQTLQQTIATAGKLCLVGEVFYCKGVAQSPQLTTEPVHQAAPIVSDLHLGYGTLPGSSKRSILHIGNFAQPGNIPRLVAGQVTHTKIHMPDTILAEIESEFDPTTAPIVESKPIMNQITEHIVAMSYHQLQMNTQMVNDIIQSLPTNAMCQFYTSYLNHILPLDQYKVTISHTNDLRPLDITAAEFSFEANKLTGRSAPCIKRIIDKNGTTQSIELATLVSATFTRIPKPPQQ